MPTTVGMLIAEVLTENHYPLLEAADGPRRWHLEPEIAILTKPFAMSSLVNKVKEILEERSPL
jgi:hypothetical protein